MQATRSATRTAASAPATTTATSRYRIVVCRLAFNACRAACLALSTARTRTRAHTPRLDLPFWPAQLYDLRAEAVRWEGNAGNGVTGLEFDRRVRKCVSGLRRACVLEKDWLGAVGAEACGADGVQRGGGGGEDGAAWLAYYFAPSSSIPCLAPEALRPPSYRQEVEMNKLVVTTLEAGLKVYDLRSVGKPPPSHPIPQSQCTHAMMQQATVLSSHLLISTISGFTLVAQDAAPNGGLRVPGAQGA